MKIDVFFSFSITMLFLLDIANVINIFKENIINRENTNLVLLLCYMYTVLYNNFNKRFNLDFCSCLYTKHSDYY